MNRFNRLKHENCSVAVLTSAEKKDEKSVMKTQKSVGNDNVIANISADCFERDLAPETSSSVDLTVSQAPKTVSTIKRRSSKKLPVISSVSEESSQISSETSVSVKNDQPVIKKRMTRTRKPANQTEAVSVSQEVASLDVTSVVPEFAPLTQNSFIPVPRSAARSLRRHVEKEDDMPVVQVKKTVPQNTKTVGEHDLQSLPSLKNEERSAYKSFVSQRPQHTPQQQDGTSKVTRMSTRKTTASENTSSVTNRKPSVRANTNTNTKRHSHRLQKQATVHSLEKHQQDRSFRGDRSPSSFAESGFIPEFLLRPVFLSKAS